MRLAAEDLERRRPVWAAMSELFLDKQLDTRDHVRIAQILQQSGYSIDELDSILWLELSPALWPNLRSVAGEWAGFDLGWIERQVVTRPQSVLRRWCSHLLGGRLVRADWARVRSILERNGQPSRDPA